ncbi:hypothetical protein [Actinomadura rubrisoli]|uniref:hypothetical protein n=1 Tax=Actinomadura rubrisoli TaxID=2530368 RepID=UPI001FB839D1|nr:hypothetical protein [Actinomadura rubrisoli]
MAITSISVRQPMPTLILSDTARADRTVTEGRDLARKAVKEIIRRLTRSVRSPLPRP